MKKYYLIITFIILITSLTGCKKEIEENDQIIGFHFEDINDQNEVVSERSTLIYDDVSKYDEDDEDIIIRKYHHDATKGLVIINWQRFNIKTIKLSDEVIGVEAEYYLDLDAYSMGITNIGLNDKGEPEEAPFMARYDRLATAGFGTDNYYFTVKDLDYLYQYTIVEYDQGNNKIKESVIELSSDIIPEINYELQNEAVDYKIILHYKDYKGNDYNERILKTDQNLTLEHRALDENNNYVKYELTLKVKN